MQIGNNMLLQIVNIAEIPRLYEFIKHAYCSNVSDLRSYAKLEPSVRGKILNAKAEFIVANCETLVIRDEVNPNLIYGFALFMRHKGKLVLYFIYVKKLFRGLGLATKMMEFMKQDSYENEYALLRNLTKYSLFKDFRLNKSLI